MDEAAEVCRGVAKHLISHGSMFETDKRPPMPASKAMEGARLAEAWHEFHPQHPGGKCEIGLAYGTTPADDLWEPVAYSPLARFRTIIDRVDIVEEGDEEYDWTVVAVDDYKSSWVADDSYLEHLQRKAQAIVVHDWLEHNNTAWDVMRLGVCNLRTRRKHTMEVERGSSLFDEWRQELSDTMDAYDKMERPWACQPGAGCPGCPFLLKCEAAKELYDAHYFGDGVNIDPMAAVQHYATIDAVRNNLAKSARSFVNREALPVAGGTVGYHVKQQKVVREDAYENLLHIWLEGQNPSIDNIAGMLKAMDVSATNIEKMLKTLIKGRGAPAKRDALMEPLIDYQNVSRFGIEKS